MTITVTDFFCGAGGSSTGAVAAGATVELAANHWDTAIEVHQRNHPDTKHDTADLREVDPRRYPVTDVLIASPECTNHSQARGVSRRKQDPSLWDAPDPSAERSRATMWEVPRFAEQNRYAAIIVENVVEATRWVNWASWLMAMDEQGYERQILSLNSMHHGVPQSRDRIYIVFTRKGLRPDLSMDIEAWCPRCDRVVVAGQAWKPDRWVGRYGQQYEYRCTSCHAVVEPETEPAASIIDWGLPAPRIGDRPRPLAKRTRERIAAGLARYGWVGPVTTAGAGNTYEATPGNRARPVTEPVATQTTTSQTALATPPAYLMRNNTARGDQGHMTTPVTEPTRTITTTGHQSLLLPYYSQSLPRPVTEPIGTQTTRDTHALVDVARVVDDCGFRMLEPHEVAAAMAFPDGYIPETYSKRDRVRLAGNAVTPPVMTWIMSRVIRAMREAS